ncbi:MAG: hypothetical protein WBB28_04495 [Crinalium sp.]
MQSPVTIHPIAAIHKLRQYRKILSPDDARAYLEEQQISYSLEIIYRHFFPTEFANSTAPSYPPYPKPSRGKDYTPKEIELFHLINDNLFPIDNWVCTNLVEEKLYYIPIASNGINWETEDFDVAYMRHGWQALLLLSTYYRWWVDLSQYEEDEEVGWSESTLKIKLEKLADPELIDPELLEILCAKAESPIKFLPLAVKLMEHNTGNIWLDSYYQEEFNETPEETEETFNWTIKNIEFLASQYQESEIIWNKVNLLIDWLETDLVTNSKKVMKIWNLSSRQK